MMKSLVLAGVTWSLVACGSEPAGTGDGDGSGSGPDDGCVDPFSSSVVAPGGTVESFTSATAETQEECDAARITSTCDAQTLTWSPAPAASAACAVEELPPAGLGFYFSDCQTGAAPGCVPGDDANPGTSPDAPKRTLDGFDVDALPAGAQILFARGGSWNHEMLEIENLNATPQSPLVIRAYGAGPSPLLRTAAGIAFQIGGRWNNTTNDGGYLLRNLRIDGLGSAEWGVWMVQNVRNVTLENVEISGFEIGVHASDGEPHAVSAFSLRNSFIHHNSSMGYLGSIDDALFEGNVFEANNFSGSGLNHAIYFSNGNNAVIRGNRFVRNSVVDGRCTGGNVTIHGVVDGLLVEDNEILQDAGDGGCYGFSITAGYTTPEQFTNVIVRGNKVVNTGNCAVCIDSSPGAIVEDNVSIKQEAGVFHAGVLNPPNGGEDVTSTSATVRNNITCQQTPHASSGAVQWGGPGATVEGNTLVTGAAATTGACAP